MEHRKPEWMLVDLLEHHCSRVGRGVSDLDMGVVMVAMEQSEKVQEVYKRKNGQDLAMG